MRKIKAVLAFLTAMTMTVGAMGVTAYAEKNSTSDYPIDVNGKFDGLRGDMDDDGQITIRDAAAIALMIQNNETESISAKADYDADGYVNIRDAAAIAREIEIKKAAEKNAAADPDLEEELISELTELDPDTPIEEIERIISDDIDFYIHDIIPINTEPTGILGDVDYDGELKTADAALIAKYIAAPKYLLEAEISAINAQGDYNGDGVISTADASGIVRDIVKKYYTNKSDKNSNAENTTTDEDTSELDEELIRELTELDPDTPIEEIDDIISEYVDDNASEEANVKELTGIPGDVNNDGVINIKDSALITKYLANRIHMTQEEFDALTAQGDYNGDGVVNIKDSADITAYLANRSKSHGEDDDELIKELSEIDPDTSVEDIEEILSEYIENNAPETEGPAEQTISAEPTGIMGDINYDGVLSIRDAALIAKYIAYPEHLTDEQINAVTAQGDFNGDGIVSVRDVSDIAKYLDKLAKNKDNAGSAGPSEIIQGDMNNDGVVSFRDAAIIVRYLANLMKHSELEAELKAKGDFNGDGQTNIRDYISIVEDLIASGTFGDRYKSYEDIVFSSGDVNFDGISDLTDIVLVSKYILSKVSYPLENEVAFVNADINQDDKLDSVDLTSMIEKQLGK